MPNWKQKQISKSHKIQYQWLLLQGIEISRTPFPPCPRSLVVESHIQKFKQELGCLIKQAEKKKKKK